jgi:hypothetical protein
MAIQLACDACGKFFRTTDNFLGKKLRCICGQVLRHLGPLVEEPPNPLMNAETVADVPAIAPPPAPVSSAPAFQAVAPTVVQASPQIAPQAQIAALPVSQKAAAQKPAAVVTPPPEDDDSIIIGLRDNDPPESMPIQDEPSQGISEDDLDDLAALAPDPAAVRRPQIDLSNDVDSGAYDFAPPKPRQGPSAAQSHSALTSAVSRRR